MNNIYEHMAMARDMKWYGQWNTNQGHGLLWEMGLDI